ncbi:MAG: hypothetical protein A2297_02265 [Elusimicrobia bacterium RIFOXYB2_FULL_48_7]|nr:MAG: hypothetical protein A2297_02265 [Elusimicrobia bacterium RIFOXYB2_FULL_48_7]
MINRYPHMLHDYYIRKLKESAVRRDGIISGLSTRRDAEKYILNARKAVKKAFGPLPEKTPLNPRTTKTIDAGSYIIENIIFESRPGFMVTGNLYLPKKITRRSPGVVVPCGHHEIGKAGEPYQALGQGFASKGFVALVFDPFGQAERRQYYACDGVKKALGSTGEHTMAGNQMALAGDFIGTWMVWDGIRALDYLAQRPEVDASRVCVTGYSGGGTLTTYMMALEPRFIAGAAGCYLTTYLSNYENENFVDSENNPPGFIKSGMDEADVLIAAAPRPVIVMTEKYDMYDQRGARKAFSDISRIYTLLGKKDNAVYYMGPYEHSYDKEAREKVYAFFMKHAGIDGSSREPAITVRKPSELFASPGGSTFSAGSKRACGFTAKTAASLAQNRKKLTPATLRQKAKSVLVVKTPPANPHYKILRPLAVSGKLAAQFAIETEPGIDALLTCTAGKAEGVSFYHPPEAESALIYIPHISSYDELTSNARVKALSRKKILCALDTRGQGDSLPVTGGVYTDRYRNCCTTGKPGTVFRHNGSDFGYASLSDMYGETLLGGRVYDALCAMNFLLKNGVKKVELAGSGIGSLIAVFAALLHQSAPRVEIWDYLESFERLAGTPVFKWPFSCLPRGVLKEFDLPDVYRELGSQLKK